MLPSLKANRGTNGGLVMTRKYMNGAASFARSWPGPVTSLVQMHDTPTTDMDHVEVFPGTAETGIEVRANDPSELAERLGNAAVVLAFLSRFEAPTASLCARLGVPMVFTSEYSPHTERQIIDALTSNPLLRLRRRMWIQRTELIRRKIARKAAGLQCSGTPTYEIYSNCNPNALLFFDNRVPTAQVIADAEFEMKIRAMEAGRPLRLVFGGRLIEIKGVLELPKVAAELRRREVPFTFEIYGSGPLEAVLTEQIAALDLSNQMFMRGALDFETGWIPALKSGADLFVCCHLQGDPSSTYPEVLSCGVPLVGYDNEALSGVVAHSAGGWATPLRDIGALAGRISDLHEDRAALAHAARSGRAFAANHAFEPTMARRAAHLVGASRLPHQIKSDCLSRP